tara:strand:- start:668 stop:874 length:207 start_codon:yes stop_codon:yes gene_type:complete
MKVGDLVRCIWQPRTSRIEKGCAVQMEHYIKGELGIIVSLSKYGTPHVLFPKFMYEHPLAHTALEAVA